MGRKKFIIYAGSISMIVLFVAIMGSGNFLKKPLTYNDDVMKQVNLVEESVNKSQWQDAEIEINKGLASWEKVKNRIQYSVERNYLEDIEGEMASLKGAIRAKDRDTAIITIEKIRRMWRELGK